MRNPEILRLFECAREGIATRCRALAERQAIARPRWGAPGIRIGRKAVTHMSPGHGGAMARMCNAANRPKPGCPTCDDLFSVDIMYLSCRTSNDAGYALGSSTTGAESILRAQVMGKFNKYVGLDVHKETIAVSVAEANGDVSEILCAEVGLRNLIASHW